MSVVSPLGPAYQAGTLSGNPLAMTAGIETLSALAEPGVYDRLERLGALFADGLQRAMSISGRGSTINRAGSLLTAFFTDGPVTDWTSAAKSDREQYAAYFHRMLEAGVYLAPSQFEAAFLSLAHTDEDLERAATAAAKALG
jgi:glutamate-1-semialdehyde 2,1-aminomutase